ncbi:acyltransferase [Bifidobacterium sp. DSM 109958]|uniref:Acyltransferase n=1 Tax=Bifidobacterium moraviense TaxID=2675323 RepID=A0A7Y0F3V8_9BIFI|nr:acyltransferase family protein [Bifidobacterium sp. DSM 109958]NMN00557.1 acyltransferase [Bifidobacterium sp. DSM 109958]
MATARASHPRRRRIDGLDGIKGLAIIAVVAYHCMPDRLTGGFVGVDVFFAVSGFLAAWGILGRLDDGRFDLGDYWLGRLRRLWPAMLLLVPVSVSAAWYVLHDALVGIRDQVVATLLSCYNWYAVATGSSYFAANNPQLFRHLWYVGVLAQSYLVIPFLLVGLWTLCGERGRGRRNGSVRGAAGGGIVRGRAWIGFAALVALAAASALAMGALYRPGQDPTRVYFGTDTHVSGLLLGMALGWALVHVDRARAARADGGDAWAAARAVLRHALPWIGALALAALVALAVTMRQDDAAFRGGIALAGVLAVLLVAGVAVRGSWLGRALDWGPLGLLGRYSYGIYLWHWPIWIMAKHAMPGFLTGQLPNLMPQAVAVSPVPPLVVTLVLTAAATALSWTLVERPAAAGGLLRVFVPAAPRTVGRWVAAALAIVVFAVSGYGFVGALLHAPAKTGVQAHLERVAAQAAAQRAADLASGDWRRERIPDLRAPRNQMPDGSQITAVGDSVMQSSTYGFNKVFPGVELDAVINRTVDKGIEALEQHRSNGTLRRWVVIGLGTNAPMSEDQLDRILDIIGPDRILVLVGTHSPDEPWAVQSNQEILAFAPQHQNRVVLVDWDRVITADPSELDADGIHPKENSTIYARAVRDAIDRWIRQGH